MRRISLSLAVSVALAAMPSFFLGCSKRPDQEPTASQTPPRAAPAEPQADEAQRPAATPESKGAVNEPGTSEGKYAHAEGTVVRIETVKGPIVIELYDRDAPITVGNFKKLVEQKFYDGLTFHRVETVNQPLVIQGGDPKGDGTGGPGWTIPLEKTGHTHITGAVGMARSTDPDSAGSQFYICKEPAHFLDGDYAVFGVVIEGLDVAKRIEVGEQMKTVRIVHEPSED